MTAIAVELVGQNLDGPKDASGTRQYRAEGTDSAAIAYQMIWAIAPALWEGLIKQTLNLEELGGGQWDGIVKYGQTPPGEQGDTKWSFQISTETVHITQAVYHAGDYPSGTAPNWSGAIGVQGDGVDKSVEGVDIKVPVFTWEETHYVSPAIITPAYLEILEATVARTNLYAFRIWQPEELLLLGVSGNGNNKTEDPIGLTFSFAASKARANFSIGGISVTYKGGHHYLWLEFERDVSNNALGRKPVAVHVERVYDRVDYAPLGLADPWN